MSELTPIAIAKIHGVLSETDNPSRKSQQFVVLHNPAEINFVRNRMLYAKAALNAKGEVQFGFRHIRRLPLSWQLGFKLIDCSVQTF